MPILAIAVLQNQAFHVKAEFAVQRARPCRALRKLGITRSKTGHCFIAAFAIAHGHELLHADSDFDPFEAHLGLRVVQYDGT